MGLQLRAVGAPERDVVQPRTAFVEGVLARQVGELVEPDEGASDSPNDVSKRPGVLIEHRLGTEKSLVALDATIEVAHGDRDVGYCWEVRHNRFLQVGLVGRYS